jgi:hypothetical protein
VCSWWEWPGRKSWTSAAGLTRAERARAAAQVLHATQNLRKPQERAVEDR